MQLKVITKDGDIDPSQVKIGDLLLCDDGIFHPVLSIAVMASPGYYLRLSNNISFNIHPRIKIKTESGFKYPELWDTVLIDKNLTPMVTSVKEQVDVRFFYDILIQGNLVSPEKIIFRFGDS